MSVSRLEYNINTRQINGHHEDQGQGYKWLQIVKVRKIGRYKNMQTIYKNK